MSDTDLWGIWLGDKGWYCIDSHVFAVAERAVALAQLDVLKRRRKRKFKSAHVRNVRKWAAEACVTYTSTASGTFSYLSTVDNA